jgi:hypothetical protein
VFLKEGKTYIEKRLYPPHWKGIINTNRVGESVADPTEREVGSEIF